MYPHLYECLFNDYKTRFEPKRVIQISAPPDPGALACRVLDLRLKQHSEKKTYKADAVSRHVPSLLQMAALVSGHTIARWTNSTRALLSRLSEDCRRRAFGLRGEKLAFPTYVYIRERPKAIRALGLEELCTDVDEWYFRLTHFQYEDTTEFYVIGYYLTSHGFVKPATGRGGKFSLKVSPPPPPFKSCRLS